VTRVCRDRVKIPARVYPAPHPGGEKSSTRHPL
jgi:hypothetical protein